MIELRDLKKGYGDIQALRGISASIQPGQIVGLLGPNGAGKSTAMKILVGYVLPTSGSATVAGVDVTADPLTIQRRIGYLPESAPIYSDMLVHEYLRFVADMRGLEGIAGRKPIANAVDRCGIGDVLMRSIGHLSKGYRQRVGLAATILHEPDILILDEPTTGLDPIQIVEIRNLIREMGETKTVILSTHILPEVEATCNRAIILIDGSIRADGTLDELTRSSVQIVSVDTPDAGQAAELFEKLPGVATVAHAGIGDRFHTYRLGLEGDREVGEAVFTAVRDRGWTLRELRRDDKTLEQVFRELTEAGIEEVA